MSWELIPKHSAGGREKDPMPVVSISWRGKVRFNSAAAKKFNLSGKVLRVKSYFDKPTGLLGFEFLSKESDDANAFSMWKETNGCGYIMTFAYWVKRHLEFVAPRKRYCYRPRIVDGGMVCIDLRNPIR